MKRNHAVLWLIWGIALLPLTAAVVAYSLRLPISEGQTQHGELLQPVVTLEHWQGETEQHTGHWTLIFRPAGECTDACRERLARLRAVHDALGRDADRVRVQLAEQSLEQLAAGVWVVDPVGNLVLRYAPEQVGPDLLQDLKRLLKVSRLG